MPAGDLAKHSRFQFSEAGFAVSGKDFGDGAASNLLQGIVGIKEAIAQRFGQGAADGAFTGAHHADQINV